jgi:hypothetical protein
MSKEQTATNQTNRKQGCAKDQKCLFERVATEECKVLYVFDVVVGLCVLLYKYLHIKTQVPVTPRDSMPPLMTAA